MEGNLIVISEGGIHMLEYLHRNGVFPHFYVMKPSYFEELVPYLSDKDNILFIIKGLTDFTLAEIYNFLKTLKGIENDVKGVTVISNVHLGENFDFDYYLYEGDLFYGDVKQVIGGKIIDNKETKGKVKNVKEQKTVNPVLAEYKVFNNNTNIKIKGKPFVFEEIRLTEVDSSLIEKIHQIDFFKENKN